MEIHKIIVEETNKAINKFRQKSLSTQIQKLIENVVLDNFKDGDISDIIEHIYYEEDGKED